MKKIKNLIIISILINITYNSHSTGINISLFSNEILKFFQTNDFASYHKRHAVNPDNAKKIVLNIYENLKSRYNENNELINQKLTVFENRFNKHIENYKKIANNEFKNNYNYFNDNWRKAQYLASGITGLKFLNGLVRGNITVYFIIDNTVHILYLEGVVITIKKEIFLCDKIFIKSSSIRFKYFTDKNISDMDNQRININKRQDNNNINIFNFILDLW